MSMLYLLIALFIVYIAWRLIAFLQRKKFSAKYLSTLFLGGLLSLLLFVPGLFFGFLKVVYGFLGGNNLLRMGLFLLGLFSKKYRAQNLICVFESDFFACYQNQNKEIIAYFSKENSWNELPLNNLSLLQEVYSKLSSSEEYFYWDMWLRSQNSEYINFFSKGSSEFTDIQMSVKEAELILSVSLSDSEEKIKSQYKRMIQKYHPDKGGNAYFSKKILDAKSCLLEEKRRLKRG